MPPIDVKWIPCTDAIMDIANRRNNTVWFALFKNILREHCAVIFMQFVRRNCWRKTCNIGKTELLTAHLKFLEYKAYLVTKGLAYSTHITYWLATSLIMLTDSIANVAHYGKTILQIIDLTLCKYRTPSELTQPHKYRQTHIDKQKQANG